MPQVLWLLLTTALVVTSHLPAAAAAAISSMAPSPVPPPPPDCPGKCGTVDIPYPFGISNDCAWPDFRIDCNHTFYPPRPYIRNIEVRSISLDAGEMHVFSPVSYICYNSFNTTASFGASWSYNFTGTPFLISPTQNVFTAIGCNTAAILHGRPDGGYYVGCITLCARLDEAAQDGDPCTGLGCCQTAIPGNLSLTDVPWNFDNNNPAWNYSPCSYAFVAQKDWYHFSRQDLIRDGNESFTSRVGERTIPMVLDWAIRNNGSCGEAGELVPPACVSTHSECVNARQGPGYLCNCSRGYTGNPYVRNGCTNIDECELRKSNPAKYETQYPCVSGSTCHDMPGDYKCKCKFWHIGDGERGCRPIIPSSYAIAIVVTFVASVLLAVLLWFVCKEHKSRMRRGFSDKNGGKILMGMDIKIFTEGELEKITNGYSHQIGKGAFGMVFMGTTDDNQLVAVKRSIVEEEKIQPRQGAEFVDEITFQFHIRHTNLVRLVGCCLETYVPRLVFEYIPRGSLHDMLHGGGADKPCALSLPQRLDIAIGSAEALAYMHSHGGHQNRIHGDVKPGNILLDNDLKPKVSDFGSSKLVAIASVSAKWCVSGDLSYLDPVYPKTGCFTEKSDVYSFGVVLLELITKKKAKYEGNKSLPIDFVRSCKEEGTGRRMYDRDIVSGDTRSHRYMECLDSIGGLAVRCLKEDTEERPTMADVVEELKQVTLSVCGD